MSELGFLGLWEYRRRGVEHGIFKKYGSLR
jgi:hypothetical protein